MAHKKGNTVLAIDIGGDSLKMAEYLVMDDGAGLELEKFDVREYPDELKELPLNEIFAETFSAMLEENDFISKSVVVSISGQVAFVRLSKLPRKIKDDKGNIQKIVELEAKQTIPYPMDEVIWDFQLVKYTVPGLREEKTEEEPEDEEDASQEPEFEDVDELESLIVAVKKDLITEIGELLEEHGKFIVSIEIASTAAYNAAKAVSIGDESCDMILNIGGRCSSLTIIDKSRIFTRVIPRAGFAVTQQICKEFNISVPEAEDLKRRHGFVALGGAYEEPDSEVAATISKVARNVMTGLHGEINRTVNMWRSQNNGAKPERMFLSGGGSLMEYTARFFEEKLRLKVDYLNPFPMIELGEEVDKERLQESAPMFSELIGLAVRYITNCPVEINLMPDSIVKFRTFQKKKPFFYISCASILICLAVFWFGVNQRLQIDKDRVKKAIGEVQTSSKMVERAQALKREFDGLKSEYDEAIRIINQRRRTPSLLEGIQQAMPDHLWLTSIKPFDSSTEKVTTVMSPDNPWAAFGGEQTAQTTVQQFDALELGGHSLSIGSEALLEPILMTNLKKLEWFQNLDDSSSYLELVGAKGKRNVTTFRIKIKLKEPLKL